MQDPVFVLSVVHTQRSRQASVCVVHGAQIMCVLIVRNTVGMTLHDCIVFPDFGQSIMLMHGSQPMIRLMMIHYKKVCLHSK